jgi:hypothetical protein
MVKVKLSLCCLTSEALRHEGLWGSGYIYPYFETSAQAGGEWSASRPGRITFLPGWIPEPVWTTWRKFLTTLGIEFRPLRPVARNQSLYRQVKVKLSLQRPWRPLGLREVEAPTFSDIRLTDGGKVVSPTRRPLFTPRKIPGTQFC